MVLCLLGLSVEQVPADVKFCEWVPTVAYIDHSGPQFSLVTSSACFLLISNLLNIYMEKNGATMCLYSGSIYKSRTYKS